MEAWGAPTFRVKTIFAMYSDGSNEKEPDEPSAWVKTTHPNQEFLVKTDPQRFFVPPYVGTRGWVGVVLSSDATNWNELRELLWDAWQMSVPKKLIQQYQIRPGGSERHGQGE